MAVGVEASQGLGVAVSIQTDGTLDLLLKQLQCLCEGPAWERVGTHIKLLVDSNY